MYRTIVVPLDRSSGAEGAITHGAAIARQAGAELELLTVRPTYTAPGNAPDRLIDSANQHGIGPPNAYQIGSDLEIELLEAAHRQGETARLRIVGGGDPATAICEAAAAPDTLVCLKTHARRALGELALGSISEQVVRSSPHPVLLIGPRCGRAPERYESIVAGLDGSELAEQILPTVAAWSSHLDLTPWLFQVLQAKVPVEIGGDDFYDSGYVHRTAEALHAHHHVKAEWDTVHARRPAAAIARFAAGLPGSAIALTTRGRSGHGRLALGSVALAVAHRATVPVLIQQSPSAV